MNIHERIQSMNDQMVHFAKTFAQENRINTESINEALAMAEKIRQGGFTEDLRAEVKNTADHLREKHQMILAAHLDIIADNMVKELRQQKMLHMD